MNRCRKVKLLLLRLPQRSRTLRIDTHDKSTRHCRLTKCKYDFPVSRQRSEIPYLLVKRRSSAYLSIGQSGDSRRQAKKPRVREQQLRPGFIPSVHKHFPPCLRFSKRQWTKTIICACQHNAGHQKSNLQEVDLPLAPPRPEASTCPPCPQSKPAHPPPPPPFIFPTHHRHHAPRPPSRNPRQRVVRANPMRTRSLQHPLQRHLRSLPPPA